MIVELSLKRRRHSSRIVAYGAIAPWQASE
jgi:hypothetical protein